MLNNKERKVIDAVKKRIGTAKQGTLFFNSSFPEYDDEYVGKILADLVRDGVIYRLSRGVFLKAKDTRFGLVYPTTGEIAKAIALRDNAEILPTGSTALNMLGMSDQVTMTPVFLTTGSARKITLGNKTITFKRGVPRNFAVRGKTTRILVQAMKAVGEYNFDNEWHQKVRMILSKYPETDTMKHDLTVMPQWIKKEITNSLKENEQLAEV